MDSLVKDYMRNHKVLVQYVRDIYGFRKGVVVAIGDSQVGWSMVNSVQDIKWAKLQPHQLPAIQKLYAVGADNLEVMESKPYKTLLAKFGEVTIPMFNKELGLMTALNRAIQGVVKTSYCEESEEVIFMGDLPYDQDILNSLDKMARRSIFSTTYEK